MVGTAMAAALGSEPVFKNKKILLLEAAAQRKQHQLADTYSSRVCALNAGTIRLLESFGSWKNVCDMRCQPVKRMQVWDACANSKITFHKDCDDESDTLAHIAENDVILSSTERQLEAMDSDVIQVKYNTRAKSYNFEPSASSVNAEQLQPWVEVVLEDGQMLRTKLLIGADGIKSLVRQTANIHTVQWEYNQLAVVATLTVAEEGENMTAWQRFLPDGPIAMLPLSNSHSCLIWTTSPENAKHLLQLTTESFVDEVNAAFTSEKWKSSLVESAENVFTNVCSAFGPESLSDQMRLPPAVVDVDDKSRASFPLGLCHSTHYVRRRVALIGDAAHRMHPLAGQGVNLGFADVASLRQHCVDAVLRGQDIGDLEHLLAYESERQRNVVPLMGGIDCLNRLYSNRITPVVFLRNIGCHLTHSLKPIKKQMMNFAIR